MSVPCTIAVYEKDGENYISLAKSTALLSVADNAELENMGKDIEAKLVQIIEYLK